MNYSPYYGLISDVQFFLLLFHGRTCCGLFWMYLKFKKNCIIICSNECSVDNHIYLSVRALEFYIEWPAQSIKISTSSNPEPCSKVYGKNRHYDHWNTHNNTINVMPIVKQNSIQPTLIPTGQLVPAWWGLGLFLTVTPCRQCWQRRPHTGTFLYTSGCSSRYSPRRQRYSPCCWVLCWSCHWGDYFRLVWVPLLSFFMAIYINTCKVVHNVNSSVNYAESIWWNSDILFVNTISLCATVFHGHLSEIW